MRKTIIAAAFAGAFVAAVAAPGAAAAQVAPDGAELRGAVVRVVSADGTTNTLNFYPDGTVSIQSPSGTETTQGRWFVQNQMLCIENAVGTRECWPYQNPFQAGQEVSLTSDCPATSQWTALQTAPILEQQPPPQQQPRPGERG